MTPAAILTAIGNDKLPTSKIAKKLDAKREDVRTALHAMKDQGLVRIVGADAKREMLWRKAR